MVLRAEPTQSTSPAHPEGHFVLAFPAVSVPGITKAGKELAKKSREYATGVHTGPGKGHVSMNWWNRKTLPLSTLGGG